MVASDFAEVVAMTSSQIHSNMSHNLDTVMSVLWRSTGAAVDPNAGADGLDLDVVDVVAAAGLESKKAFVCATMMPNRFRNTNGLPACSP